MENASKALIMVAEILIGVMILSIGVYLFNYFASYSTERYKEIEDVQIAEFNNRFLKFYGTRVNDSGKVIPIECTIHDIASLANLAQKHNIDKELENSSGFAENTLYVQIDLGSKKNIEKYTNHQLTQLMKENDIKKVVDETTGKMTVETKYYKCVVCNVNTQTRRVNYVRFEELK